MSRPYGRPRTLAWLLILAALAPRAAAQDAPPAEAPAAADSEQSPSNDQPPDDQPVEIAARLLDRDPFDRITLDAANGNAVIETVLLDLPDRSVPDPLPESGNLSLRRLSEPSIPYEVSWSAIEKIELYEYMLLAEAERLTAAGEFAEAFEYLAFLSSNYPQLPGLENSRQSHLWREASAAFAAGRRDEAWPILQALYLRNPNYPRLANAVKAVSDDIIGAHLESGDYDAARAVLTVLQSAFPELELANVARWQQRFQSDAAAAMDEARAALAAERYSEARAAVNRAHAILPEVPGGEELWRKIQSSAPEIRVGVLQAAGNVDLSKAPTWPVARVAGLTEPRLTQMVDFGAEGGVYGSAWGDIATSDDGLETTITLSASAMRAGLGPDVIALHLIEVAAGSGAGRQVDFAAVLDNIRIANGNEVVVRWRRPPIKPEAFLQLPLRGILSSSGRGGMWFDPIDGAETANERRYQRSGIETTAEGEAKFIVERVFDSDDAALAAITSGDVDALDRVPPWQVERLRGAQGIAVGTYRLPTTHVLIPNPANPLLQTREFRRAICYGIDSESIVRDILLAGQPQTGFSPLSGPFPAGASLSDPVGYAYNAQIPPRPYEPRLAALLSGVARKTLAKREAEAKKKEQEASPPPKDVATAKESATDSGDAGAEGDNEELPPPEALVLAHSTDPIARLACQTIKTQLDGVGIPVRLAEFTGHAPPSDFKYDLLYAEVAMWEPLVDARGLLGPDGLAGRASPLVTLALDQLATSENWNQALTRLREIHRITHYDLPVLPLWQTVNYFAHRQSLEGVGETPVSLYQNLPAWRKSFE